MWVACCDNHRTIRLNLTSAIIRLLCRCPVWIRGDRWSPAIVVTVACHSTIGIDHRDPLPVRVVAVLRHALERIGDGEKLSSRVVRVGHTSVPQRRKQIAGIDP
jgi:hypothetical protein